jgi:hypothetical protein|tara:strand:+ start:65 stop:601 length:537 start_codon:yes stop_codon:yes gene_type:complete
MSDIIIQDNFLDADYFQRIRDYVLDYNNGQFNWYMNDVVRPGDNKKLDYQQFVHMVYGYGEVYSEFHNQINGPGGLIEKLDPYSIIRIKLNLITRHTDVVESGMHIDVPHAPDVAVTSILYMNTNNGYTKFETGEKVESIANRLVTFPNNIMHTGTSCSDEIYRCVMNIDYIKNQRTA